MSRAAADAATQYQHTFDGQANQVAQVRRQIAAYLDGCPAAQDAVLIASELAANAVLHSAGAGEFFTVRCQACPRPCLDRSRRSQGPLAARSPRRPPPTGWT